MSKIFDRLFFIGPLGLGDNFVHSGIVHYFGDRCIELHVPVWPAHFETITTLYQDHPHIKVVPLKHYDLGENQYVYENRLSRILPTDLIRTTASGVTMAPLWDVQIYANYEIPFTMRYDNFRLPKLIPEAAELYDALTGDEPYVLVHRRSGKWPAGMPVNIQEFRKHSNLPDIKIIEVFEGITNNMMHYVKLIENAQEIHCIPSSFHCLVDSMNHRTNARLFFHDIRDDVLMKVNSISNQHRWIIVNYPTKL
jgi:hypothetical protein